MSPEIVIPQEKCKEIEKKLDDWVLFKRDGSINYNEHKGYGRQMVNYLMEDLGSITVETYQNMFGKVTKLWCSKEQLKLLKKEKILDASLIPPKK